MSQRTLRVGALIRNILAGAIRDLNDPRIEPITSIMRVEVSPDLLSAKVAISVFAAPARRQATLDALRRASGRLRSVLANELSMRTVPRIQFVLDDSIQKAAQTVNAVDAAMAELGERPDWERDGEPADEPAPPDEPALRDGEKREDV